MTTQRFMSAVELSTVGAIRKSQDWSRPLGHPFPPFGQGALPLDACVHAVGREQTRGPKCLSLNPLRNLLRGAGRKHRRLPEIEQLTSNRSVRRPHKKNLPREAEHQSEFARPKQ